ncbi:MAG TPA: hypothetical protein VFZ49_01315 [Pyrinomonadaceae bacterium]
MKSLWKIIERDGRKGKWSLPYVSLSPKGEILLTRVTWEKTGSPAAYLIMFDETNQRIGLKATGLGIKNAYKAYKSGNAGSRTLSCRRMLVEHGIKLKHGIRFTDIEIDRDGFITLDLRTAVINNLSVTRQHRESQKQSNAIPAE